MTNIRPSYENVNKPEFRAPRDGDDVVVPLKTKQLGSSEIKNMYNNGDDIGNGDILYDNNEERLVSRNFKYLAGIRDTGKKVSKMGDLLGETPSWWEKLFSSTPQRNLLGFREANDGAEGSFIWEVDRSKQDHDGGTVVDPDHSATPGSSGWYDPQNNGNGCWVRSKSKKQTGQIFQFPLRWFGLLEYDASKSNKTGHINSKVMNYLLTNHRGFLIDGQYYFNESLLFDKYQTIRGIERRSSVLFWDGDSSDWAIRIRDKSVSAFNSSLLNFNLKSHQGGKTGNGANLSRFTFSRFDGFEVNGFDTGAVLARCWNNLFTACRFLNCHVGCCFGDDKIFGMNNNINNATRFIKCLFVSNDIGQDWYKMGSAVVFSNCILTNNGTMTRIQQAGNAFNITWQDGYIEKNGTIFDIKQAIGGSRFSLFVKRNFISGGSDHKLNMFKIGEIRSYLNLLSVTDNVITPNPYDFKDNQTGIVFDKNVNTSHIDIQWRNNHISNNHVKYKFKAFDPYKVDWRRVDTDVRFKVAIDQAKVDVIEPVTLRVDHGIAHIRGIIKPKNSNIKKITTKDIPHSLTPKNNFALDCISYTGYDQEKQSTTINIAGSSLFIATPTTDQYHIDESWSIGQDNMLFTHFIK